MFFIRFTITLLVLLCIWIGVIIFQIDRPTKMSQWVYDVYNKKTKLSKKIKTNKIIIVSGSNSLFGIDSKLLSKELGKKVINFSVNAGVMLPYTLYKAKKVIKKGDTVLLPLEYSMYNYNGEPNEQMIDYIFSRDFDAFYSLTKKEQFYMFWNITFRRIYNGYFNNSTSKVKYGLYGSHNIDKYGDQIKTSIKYKSKNIQKELDNHKANSYGKEFDQESLSWKYLKEFTSWCKKNNVKFVFTPPTLLYFDKYKTDKKEKWYYNNINKLVERNNWEYIGNPYDYMYKKQYYFNTDFHLNDKGREIRTKQMIKDLKLKLFI